MGDKLNLKVSDAGGTDFTSLSGVATFTSAAGVVTVLNIDKSEPITAGDLGHIKLTDLSQGVQIVIGLASGPMEVRIDFPGTGSGPTKIRFISGLDKLGVKIRIK